MRGYSITLYEIKAEPGYVIYMSTCLLLDPFQKYLGISVVFALVMFTATTNTTVENENVMVRLWEGGGRGGEYSTKGRSVSNCREDENMVLSPCTKYFYLQDGS